MEYNLVDTTLWVVKSACEDIRIYKRGLLEDMSPLRFVPPPSHVSDLRIRSVILLVARLEI